MRPRSVVFIEEHDAPGDRTAVSGRWIASAAWPESASSTALALGGPAVAPASAAVGLATGNWCPPPPDSGLFGDQRADEARAPFREPPLAEPVAVLGAARVRLQIAHPGPRAIVSVKLNDVSPAGESQPVTRGAVNVACAGRPTSSSS